MQAQQIYKDSGTSVVVRGDSMVAFEYGGTKILLAADQAARLAQILLEAVTHISKEISRSMEDVPDTIEETREAVEEMKATVERFKELEQ